jgi:aerobic carbon-monoxide dehydrogenase large subunit
MGVRYFGARVDRLEDPSLLSGRGRYVDDLHVHGLLHAAFVRSPMAHAKIRSINADAARDMPGVVAILTLADLDPAQRMLPAIGPAGNMPQFKTTGPLAKDEVNHVGVGVAMVIAQTRYQAEDAAFSVDVDYEELAAVADFRRALDADAPKAHASEATNLVSALQATFGDANAVFAKAAHVFKETIKTHRGGCHSMECRGVMARPDELSGRLEVWSATQMPHSLRRAIAMHLGLDINDVRVVVPDVGGGFGPKASLYPEEYAVAMAAKKLGRPVKWIEDRKEHFLTTTQQRDTLWEMEVAATAEGRITGMRGRCLHDVGAYIPYGLIVSATALNSFPGPYALDALELKLDAVYTNMVPVTPIRGAGRPDACFVMERLVEKVAHELKIPASEVRRRSFVRADQMPYMTGLKGRDGKTPIAYDSGDYAACLDKAIAGFDVEGFRKRQALARAQGRFLGLGMSSCVEDTGVGPYEGATIRIDVNGRVIVSSGAAAQGQGTRTILAQIAADALGVDINNVTVELQDTDKFPLGMGAVGSRTAVMAGSGVHNAAQALRGKILASAAAMLESGNKFLELEGGEVHIVAEPGRKVSLAAVAQRHAGAFGAPMPAGVTPDLSATAYAEFKGLAFANGTNAAEIEVDVETGEVRVRRYVVAHDCGRMINPRLVDGQIQGGVVHGIGNALFERMLHDDHATPLSVNYGEYLLPMSCEMPRVEIHHMETPSPVNPIGVKGAGEGGTIPAAACIISGIEDALAPFGIRINEHPVSPARIVELIAAARGRKAA